MSLQNTAPSKKSSLQWLARFFMLAGLGLFMGATAQDIELEKQSSEQRQQISTLEATIAKSRIQHKQERAQAEETQKTNAGKLAERKQEIEESKQLLGALRADLESSKNNPPARYDQITFANGASFVGEVIRYTDEKITIKSASGEEKTGPLTIMKSIELHLLDLAIEEFPVASKRAAPRARTTSHAQVMAKFNPSLLGVIVSRGDKNYDDGITKKGRTTFFSSASEDVQLKVKVAYKNPQAVVEGTKLEVFALGRDIGNKKLGQIIIKQSFKLDPINPKGVEVATRVKHISYQSSKYHSKKMGIDYHSYLVVLKDKEGKILYTKGSRSSVEALYEELQNLSSGDSFSY